MTDNMNIQAHEAEAYLRNPENPSSVYVRIGGKRRRIFMNRGTGQFGIIAEGKRNFGYIFDSWKAIEKVYYPASEAEKEKNLVKKYQRLAEKATFKSPWLDIIKEASEDKSLFENRITTGNRIDGKVITLKTIEKYCGDFVANRFREAVKNCTNWYSSTFDFGGYDGRLWVEPREDGKIAAGFSKEFRGCGNGYYYLLINDETFIGYDVD